jgi:hypothetical protein
MEIYIFDHTNRIELDGLEPTLPTTMFHFHHNPFRCIKSTVET